ncbi:iron-containing alcohol dehydrogenase [Dickeya fangzhongdai]|uniref:iron-containing alcohol dehydrogenase family protein n=1 Tax=Dickeya fangzhongdai TaxID=1778540 RepID=UPI001EFBA3E6|nr:iron-containing alcohol dehydrogenase [Dickeya fangzhongdai]ULR30669.1 iron-containing alcohol dehydrogenase [Dickeya fangzhongdai]
MAVESAFPGLDSFSFSLPVKIHFERGALKKLSQYLLSAGKKNALLVMSQSTAERSPELQQLIADKYTKVKYDSWLVPSDFKATTASLREIQIHLQKNQYDSIISVGGGNIIDFTKAAAISMDKAVDLDNLFAKSYDNIQSKIFHIAVPTTFGTGSEVTKGAIILDTKSKIKDGVRGDFVFPDVALIDPDLGFTMPDTVLRETLFDSFTHAFEALHAVKSNPVTESLAVESLRRINANIDRYASGNLDEHFYTEAAYSALLGGICVCHNSTCLPHRFEQAFAPFYSFSHGRGLAAIYPSWVSSLMAHGKVSPLLAQVSNGLDASEYLASVLGKIKLGNASQQLSSLKLSDMNVRKKVSGNITNDPIVNEAGEGIINALLNEIIGG